MVKELLKHMFPRRALAANLRITYTFFLGGLALTSLVSLTLSGLLLLFYYSPTPGASHVSVQFLESAVWGGAYLRSFHRFASHTLLVALALHALRVVLTGAFARPWRLNWVVGSALLVLALFEAYTGYLLPMDQLAYWATQTGMELLRTLPLGDAFRSLLVPDDVGGPLSLLRFYALHIAIVPGALLILCALHFFVIRRQKGLLPYAGGKGPAAPENLPSSPHLFRLVKRGAFASLSFLLLMAALVPAPLELAADPAHSPNPAKSAWFLLWIQELVSYSTQAIYVPVLLLALFVALPWLPVRRVEKAVWFPAEQRVVQIGVLLAGALVVFLTVVGFFLRGADWRLQLPF